MTRPAFTLPLLPSEPPAAPAWEGFTAAAPLSRAPEAPEPDAPQGDYAETPAEAALPLLAREGASHPVELLSPAGGPDAAFAAFHFGADAVYLGLKKFSARAEARSEEHTSELQSLTNLVCRLLLEKKKKKTKKH